MKRGQNEHSSCKADDCRGEHAVLLLIAQGNGLRVGGVYDRLVERQVLKKLCTQIVG